MAVILEQRGQDFYRKAAIIADSVDEQRFFEHLAEMEKIHEEFFTKLLEKANISNAYAMLQDSDAAFMRYLKRQIQEQNGATIPQSQSKAEAFISKTVFSKSPADAKPADNSPRVILEQAIASEKDAIAFYLSLRPHLQTQPDRAQIDSILAEEMSHLTLLSTEILKLQKPAQ